MTGPDITSLIASVVSITVGIIAIGLAAFFFKISSDLTERNNQAANRIEQSVKQLSTIFDHFYSDTFSLIRDQMHGMQRHILGTTLVGAPDSSKSQEDSKGLETLKQLIISEYLELKKTDPNSPVYMTSIIIRLGKEHSTRDVAEVLQDMDDEGTISPDPPILRREDEGFTLNFDSIMTIRA